VKRLLTVFLFLLSTTLGAQAPDPKPLPLENKAAILEIQLRMVQTQSEYAQLQERIKTLQENFQKDAAALQTAEADACKAAKLDCDKEWTLNLQTLKFEPKAKEKKP
jgi:hypothetical protein